MKEWMAGPGNLLRLVAAALGVACIGVGTAATAEPTRGPSEWRFAVLLGEREIGQHRFRIQPRGDATEVRSEARFDVKFLGFNAFVYRHEATERWRGDCLEGIESRTDHNGRPYNVTGARETERFRLRTLTASTDLPACIMTFAYWNPRMLGQQRLLNSQTGEFVDVRIEAKGTESLRAAGATVDARRYTITGRELQIDLWYGPDGRWVGLESLTEGGRRLRYLLM